MSDQPVNNKHPRTPYVAVALVCHISCFAILQPIRFFLYCTSACQYSFHDKFLKESMQDLNFSSDVNLVPCPNLSTSRGFLWLIASIFKYFHHRLAKFENCFVSMRREFFFLIRILANIVRHSILAIIFFPQYRSDIHW